MPSSDIRDALTEDLVPIVEIYNSNIPRHLATADTKPIAVESRFQWFADHSPHKYPLWVVETDDKQIIGWLGFQGFYGRVAYEKTAELSIYIHLDYQHQGIGKKLLEKAIQESPQLGLKVLLGFIFAHNQASLKLFAKHEFKEWGYLPQVAELGGVERDLVIMGRKISA